MAVSPTEQGRVGSGYGERTSSRTGNVTFHAGWDFVAVRHTPIYAAEDGIVERFDRERPGGPMRGYGNAVVVRHADDTWALYAHLETVDVREGETVRAGQEIGTAGNTTNGRFPRMPPHLHLEIRHARPDGSSPFPGPYGRLNLDPKDWFARKGLVIGNRWQRPPGTIMPGALSGMPLHYGGAAAGVNGPVSEGGRFHAVRMPEWWETTFPQRAPRGTSYTPGVEMTTGGLWDWSGLIAGAVILNGGYFLATGKLPIIGRRKKTLEGWSEDTRRVVSENPNYFMNWYTVKSLGLVAAVGVAAYYIGKDAGR